MRLNEVNTKRSYQNEQENKKEKTTSAYVHVSFVGFCVFWMKYLCASYEHIIKLCVLNSKNSTIVVHLNVHLGQTTTTKEMSLSFAWSIYSLKMFNTNWQLCLLAKIALIKECHNIQWNHFFKRVGFVLEFFSLHLSLNWNTINWFSLLWLNSVFVIEIKNVLRHKLNGFN